MKDLPPRWFRIAALVAILVLLAFHPELVNHLLKLNGDVKTVFLRSLDGPHAY